MHPMRRYIAAITLLVGAAGGNAHAGSLSTDVSVSLPSTIILSCFDDVDVDVTPDNFLAAVHRNPTRAQPNVTRNARVRSGDLVVNAPRRPLNRRVRVRPRINLDLNEVCAYHAFGTVSGARVEVDQLEGALAGTDDSSISIIRIRARDSVNGGAWRTRFLVPPEELGFGVIRGVDVRLRLDLSNATSAGLYSGPADGTFRITLTSNP